MPDSTPQALDVSVFVGGETAGTSGGDRSLPSSFAQRYDLLAAIGGGGMGVVYRARDRVLGRTVAVKILPPGWAGDPSMVARFQREARAAASLCHPNVVSIFDAGSDETTWFIAMEYVRGMSLATLLRRHGRLPLDRAVDLGAQTAAGLAAAHRAGIVHRDVKPSNVMVDESSTVKLLDFGIARVRASTSLTQMGSVLGSARYIAPEMIQGDAAEERSDVYSLGCVLYEMVTGDPPFSGELDAALLHQHVTARPRPPRTLAPELPPALDALIVQMLAKRASERPSAELLVTALGRLRHAPTRTRAPRPGVPRRDESRKTEPMQALEMVRPGRRTRLAIAAMVAVFGAIGFAIATSASPGGHGANRDAASAAHLHKSASAQLASRALWPRLPAGAGAFHDAALLVATTAAALQAARTPPAPEPRTNPPAKSKRAPRAPGKHQPARHKHETNQSERNEVPPASSEAEVPPPEAEAPLPPETPPPETTPAESPPPPASSPPGG
jgi:eukaryotic-like serine/threonine-protein kinase